MLPRRGSPFLPPLRHDSNESLNGCCPSNESSSRIAAGIWGSSAPAFPAPSQSLRYLALRDLKNSTRRPARLFGTSRGLGPLALLVTIFVTVSRVNYTMKFSQPNGK